MLTGLISENNAAVP